MVLLLPFMGVAWLVGLVVNVHTVVNHIFNVLASVQVRLLIVRTRLQTTTSKTTTCFIKTVILKLYMTHAFNYVIRCFIKLSPALCGIFMRAILIICITSSTYYEQLYW